MADSQNIDDSRAGDESDHVRSEHVRSGDDRSEHVPSGDVRSEHDPSDQQTDFVPSLPDLIDASEYAAHPEGRLVRVRISVTDAGVEVLGDAFRPAELERMLAVLGGGPTEEMLCG